MNRMPSISWRTTGLLTLSGQP